MRWRRERWWKSSRFAEGNLASAGASQQAVGVGKTSDARLRYPWRHPIALDHQRSVRDR